VAPEAIAALVRFVRRDPQRHQRLLAHVQGRFEGLALHHLHAALAQIEVVRDVAGAREDRQVGEVLTHVIHQRQTVFDAVDGVDQQLGLVGPGGLQQVHARGVAVEDAETEAA
jgi:hypothetical protein